MTVRNRDIDPYHQSGPYGLLLWYALRDFKSSWTERAAAAWKGNEDQLRNQVGILLGDALDDLQNETGSGLQRTILSTWPYARESQLNEESKSVKRVAQIEQYLKFCQQKHANAHVEDLLGSLVWAYVFTRYDKQRGITWMPPAGKALPPASGIHNLQELAKMAYPSLGFVDTDADMEIMSEILLAGSLEVNSVEIGHVQDQWRPLDSPYLWDDHLLASSDLDSTFSDAFYFNQEALYMKLETEGHEVGRLIFCSPLRGLLPLIAGPVALDDDEAVVRVASLALNSWNDINGLFLVDEVRRNLRQTLDSFIPARRGHYLSAVVSGRRHFINNLVLKNGHIANTEDLEDLRDALRLIVWVDRSTTSRVTTGQSKPEKWCLQSRSVEEILRSTIPGLGDELEVTGPDATANIEAGWIPLLYELLTNAVFNGKLEHCNVIRTAGETLVEISTTASRVEAERIVDKLSRPLSLRQEAGLDHVAGLIENLRADAEWCIELPDGPVLLARYSAVEEQWEIIEGQLPEPEPNNLAILIRGNHYCSTISKADR